MPVLIESVLFPNTFGMELIYSFVIIFCSLIIYFSTKKMYDISKYPGIKYFRESFLFFAIAYFFKSFLSFLLVTFGFHEALEFSSIFWGILTLFVFMYASTMAIFYLFYSVVWKKIKHKKFVIPAIHILVIILSIASIITRTAGLLVLLQVVVFLFIAIYNFISYKKLNPKKKAGSIHLIYLFLFAFWMLNLSDILISGFDPIFELVISLVSIGIFLMILYKVTSNVGAK
jgi:hypothetical protein